MVLAEDNYIVREGVEKLINSEPDLEVVAACADYDSLMGAVAAETPDVVVTDIRMPPTGTDEGIRAANELRAEHPDLGVVVLSQYSEPKYALDFLESGSRGRAYLLKERVSNIGQLAQAIRDVARGGSVIDPEVVDALVAARSRASDSPLRVLTATLVDAAREGDPGRDGAGQEQRGGRRVAHPLRARRREAHQLDLLEARPVPGARCAPPGEGGAPLPVRTGLSPLGVQPPPKGTCWLCIFRCHRPVRMVLCPTRW